MIHIARSSLPVPKVLTDPNGRGAKERMRALEFYKNPANEKKSFSFDVYKDPEVVEALDKLFHHKCAYCESPYAATQKVAVEHFRPKGAVRVNGELKGQGYYWLAAEWDNLLPFCTDCNSPRTQNIPGEDRRVLGKGIEFPIANERKRAVIPGQENEEERLLINPCLDHPDEHLVFDLVEKDEVVVRPALMSDGKESPMGIESIRVYALLRPGLAEARRNHLLRIRVQVARTQVCASLAKKYPEDEGIQKLVRDEVQELDKMLEDDQPYAGMARQIVNRVFQLVDSG